jgi:hypothetical protein
MTTVRAWLCFLLGGAAAAAFGYAVLVETQPIRRGWFELPGQPLTLDGRSVTDWLEVNDILARPPADLDARLVAFFERRGSASTPEAEFLDREFVLEYRAEGSAGTVHRVKVRRFLPMAMWWGTREHPSASARHEVVDSREPGGR